jgi:LmbE family N-acetylglucosaminyl deacetylase
MTAWYDECGRSQSDGAGVAEVLPDHEVKAALVIMAHPDDAEFWAGGTIAVWSAAGCKVTYLLLTDGDAGGFDHGLPRSELPGIRREEQRDAAAILGSDDVRFLGRPEGSLVNDAALRAQVVRVIRQVRPQRVLTWSPEWNWSRFRTSCHADHRATGEVALTAIYPDAGNRFAHPALLDDEGLEPWNVQEIWMINGREPNHYVDITETFNRKIEALQAHSSQIADPDSLVDRMRERIAPNTAAAGLADCRYAEAFQVVVNR